MNARFSGVVFVSFAAFSACTTDVKAPPPPPAARVVSFTADKPRVAAGESVTLTFATENATEVQLIDDQGQFIELSGEVSQGSAAVSPTRSTFYVLRANGLGGRDTAFAQVAVDEPLRDLFLLSVPGEVQSGESAQLLWGAAGAAVVTLTSGSGTSTTLTGGTGTVLVTPSRSERYTLTASAGASQPTLTALAEVRVLPKLLSFELQAPAGIDVGERLSLRWQTAGAERVVVREVTFGSVLDTTDAQILDTGTVSWTVPGLLPTGLPLQSGVPLHFDLTVSSNAGSVTQRISAVVGDAPVIERLSAPAVASAGGTFVLSWNTLGAAKVDVRVGSAAGATIFETLPTERDRAAAGFVSLNTPATATDFVLVATNDRGVSVTETVNVRPVAQPTITSFTLSPPTINAAGDTATAVWQATNARRVQLRHQSGGVIGQTTVNPNGSSMPFRAASSQALVLDVFNEAGDVASATATLRLAGASGASLSPTPVLRGDAATLTWDLASLGVTDVVGLPTPRPAVIAGSLAFVDLTQDASAVEVLFADRGNGAARVVPPAGFRASVLGVARPELWVSVNGFIAFAAPASLSTNTDIGLATNTAPTLLAPYWDDLTLATTSKVLTGFGPDTVSGERVFVVQWNKVQGAGGAELTFEVQLTETGAVSFHYLTMNAQTGASATIGVKDVDLRVVDKVAYNAAGSVVDGDEVRFFSGAAPAGSVSLAATATRTVSFFGRTGLGLVAVQVPMVALAPGDLRLTEAMPAPHSSALAFGQWVEIGNTTSADIELGTLTLSTNATPDGGAFVFTNARVPANGFLVVGQSTNATENGGAGVSVVWNDVLLNDLGDSVTLSLGSTPLSALTWASAATAGRSIQVSEGLLSGSGGGGALCTTATGTFGPNGAIGTPGQRNEACLPYRLERVDGGYVDLSLSPELLPGVSAYDGRGTVALPVPFTYFGQQFTDINVSMVGFFTFGAPLTAAYNVTNDVLPNGTEPNGVVAPFWDEIVRNTSGSIRMRRDADRTIVSWQDFRIYATTSSMNFQVHLLDTGVIEFHYGAFTGTGTAVARMRGSSATVWLETPSGGAAIPAGVNTDGTIVQNSGFRFTP